MHIGIAGTDRQEEEDWIMNEVDSRGHDAVFIRPSAVSYTIADGELDIRYDGRSLNDLEVLFMRRTRFDLAASRDLIAAMDTCGVRTIERKDVFYNPLSKFISLLNFVGTAVDRVQIPSTGIVKNADDAEATAKRIGYPLITKPIAGREGEGVESIAEESELAAYLDGAEFPVLLQQFLNVAEEYRVLVVGDTALGAVTKEPVDDDDGSVARNFAQGAEFNAADVPELFDPAVQIAQAMQIELAGVDIVRTTDGAYYEIECNRCPQFEGFSQAHPDVDVPARIVDYIEEQGR
jgi:RimK family alpha-L-glutamate ligase